ncbi:MAG TPA: metallophosphoesterase [Candidatus Angelobacter sp.]|nr:metallophosphoesterase [Candidatus Angelobacter sp.]
MKNAAAGHLRRAGLSAVALLAILFLAGVPPSESVLGAGSQSAKNATAVRTASGEEEQTIVAAGDIVDCPNVAGSEATARLLDSIPGTVLAIGDLAYPDGSDDNFLCYEKTWGRHKARTRPTPGNHEYHTPGAAGYLKYFGESAGTPGHTYYSFNLGAWHIIALDSECKDIGGCQKGSPEELWLRKDLKQNSSNCILAFWHIPLFSSGDEHGNAPEMKPFWDDLYAAGADIVLNGHDHDYERFAPQNSNGVADPGRGIREFVVGTGGKSKRGFRAPSPTSEVRNSSTYGVLQIKLRAHDYQWRFVPVAGGQFSDSGSGTCHK